MHLVHLTTQVTVVIFAVISVDGFTVACRAEKPR